MKLDEVLSISGKPGLFRLISQNKSNFIVESLVDKKRMPVFQNDRVSTLDNIAVFTEEENIPLADVFVKIFEKENAQKVTDYGNDFKQIEAYIAEILPEYDKERVHPKDMKKMLQWYNILLANNYLTAETIETYKKNKKDVE